MSRHETYFIGIGGIGMSALAHVLLQRNEKVAGSDIKESVATRALRNAGAEIRIGQVRENIKPGMKVVYSSAISKDNPEYLSAQKQGLSLIHRSDMLTELMGEKQTLCVTGTHGKTTTTSLLAWALCCARIDPSFVIGGIPSSLKINGHQGTGEYFIAEADESDGSFLKHPVTGGIITNIDYDHLNYWKTKEALEKGFETYIQSVKNKDLLFYCGEDPWLSSYCKQGISYGFSKDLDLYGLNFYQDLSSCRFDICFRGKSYSNIELAMRGKHNLLNSLGVFGLAITLGIPEEEIRIAFKSFEGVKRRAELLGEARKIHLFDDYAHHPTEIKALLDGFSGLPEKEGRLVVVFQPHRFTRTKDCFSEYVHSFEKADQLICTEIFSAGEAQMDGVSSEKLIEEIQRKGHSDASFVRKDELISHLTKTLQEYDVVLIVGAGDISAIGPKLLSSLKENA